MMFNESLITDMCGVCLSKSKHTMSGVNPERKHTHIERRRKHANKHDRKYLHVQMRSLDNICMDEGTFSRIHHRWVHGAFFQLK